MLLRLWPGQLFGACLVCFCFFGGVRFINEYSYYYIDDVEQPSSVLGRSKTSNELKSHPVKGGWCITEYLTYDW